MLSNSIFILGKSTFAIGIIADIIKLNATAEKVFVVPNLTEEQNESNKFPFENTINFEQLTLDQFNPRAGDKYIIGSIGKGKKAIYSFFQERFELQESDFLDIIHPNTVIADTVKYGHGLHMGPNATIAPFTNLGHHVTISRNASVGHHGRIGNFVTINPGANIAGICHIGEGTTISMGTNVLENITIGSNVIVGAGSVVTRDIPDNVIAYGVPAKVIKNR